jgi:hypothetical protein
LAGQQKSLNKYLATGASYGFIQQRLRIVPRRKRNLDTHAARDLVL